MTAVGPKEEAGEAVAGGFEGAMEASRRAFAAGLAATGDMLLNRLGVTKERRRAFERGGEAVQEAEQLGDHVRVHTSDFYRGFYEHQTYSRAFLVGGLAVGTCVLLLFGVLVQHRFEPMRAMDSTNGWKDEVWRVYGARLVECTQRATEQGTGAVCRLSIGTTSEGSPSDERQP